MVSICIPIYNFTVSPLVQELYRQGSALGYPFEILMADDASAMNYRGKNAALANELPHIRYLQLESNIGRSRIRNFLATEALYDQIIFMDCDSMPPDSLYLYRYLAYNQQKGVVCGGRIYSDQKPQDATLLHWTFGRNREALSARQRNQKPYQAFMTPNFMINKSVFQCIRFNPELQNYGHEDTLFGFELKTHQIPLLHIDNPLIHIDLQPTKIFLHKTRTAIENLLLIDHLYQANPELRNSIKLLRSFHHLKKWKFQSCFARLHRLWVRAIEANLRSQHPWLRLLDLYKLGVICEKAYRK